MPPPPTIDLEVDALASDYDARVAAACPQHATRAADLLRRLSPDQWGIEWFLPAWLGEAFGLEPGVVRDLVVGNLLGLAAVRTFDDLADDDVPPADRDAARDLADDLLAEALRPYRTWFEAGSPFWSRLDAWLAEWRGTVAGEPRTDQRLAARGAPLKAAAYAACLLGGRTGDFPALERCLDRGLTARVLYDHVVDWEDDLAAGRWNAFVAAAARLPQRPENRAVNRTAVLRAQVATDLVAQYFARITAASESAARGADRLGIRSLADHDRSFAMRAADHGDRLRAHYVAVGRQAAARLFGSEAPVGAADRPT